MARVKGWPAKYKGLRRWVSRGKNRRAKCKACRQWCAAKCTRNTHLAMVHADLTTLCIEFQEGRNQEAKEETMNSDKLEATPATRSMLQEHCERTGRDYAAELARINRSAKEEEERYRKLNMPRPSPAETPRTPAAAGPSPAKTAAMPIEIFLTHPLLAGIKTKAELRKFLAELLFEDMHEIAMGAIEGSKSDGTVNAGQGEGEDGGGEDAARAEAAEAEAIISKWERAKASRRHRT